MIKLSSICTVMDSLTCSICRVRFVWKNKRQIYASRITKKHIFEVTIIFRVFWCFDQSDSFCKYRLYLPKKSMKDKISSNFDNPYFVLMKGRLHTKANKDNKCSISNILYNIIFLTLSRFRYMGRTAQKDATKLSPLRINNTARLGQILFSLSSQEPSPLTFELCISYNLCVWTNTLVE